MYKIEVNFLLLYNSNQLNMSRNKLPDQDQDNRILTLYYDVNINTIFNRTKLQNIKNKFWKYVNYLIKYEKNNIQPNILRFQHDCWKYKMLELEILEPIEPKVSDGPEYFRREYEKCSIEINSYITMQTHYNNMINKIGMRIKQIKTHQNFVHKNYKKCAHCEKINTFIISGCKSKHKLCSECIYDKTECPVCNEDLCLVHCDICYEYKKELVDTGCKNKHQTCKDCLDKFKQKNNNCPFCRGCCSKEPLAIPDYWSDRSEEEDEALAQEWMQEGYWREREEIEEEHRRYREWQEEEDRRDSEETEEDRRESRRESRRERE